MEQGNNGIAIYEFPKGDYKQLMFYKTLTLKYST